MADTGNIIVFSVYANNVLRGRASDERKAVDLKLRTSRLNRADNISAFVHVTAGNISYFRHKPCKTAFLHFLSVFAEDPRRSL